MKRNQLISVFTLAFTLLGGCASTPSTPGDGTIHLKTVRGFHVGGERMRLSGLPLREVRTNPQAVPRMADPNGDYQVGQLYVQQFSQVSPKGKVPILLWHGGGLTGVTWETTPDGRSGWHELELVQRVCPCIIIGHSQPGMFVFTAAQAAPDKVKAVIMVESASALDPAKFSGANVKHIPHLVVWGDQVTTDKVWSTYRTNAQRYTSAITAAGGIADTFDLPAMGLRGNSHMVMMDKNSDEVARLIRGWLVKQGLEH